MSKIISLTQGYIAIVDDDDFEKVSKHKWCVKKTSHNVYAKRYSNSKTIDMHHVIIERKEGFVVDHINGDGLDNRKENLRLCTHSENMKNIKMRKDNLSGVRGVYWNAIAKKWHCQIQFNGKKIYLGLFKELDDAKNTIELHQKKLSNFYQTRN